MWSGRHRGALPLSVLVLGSLGVLRPGLARAQGEGAGASGAGLVGASGTDEVASGAGKAREKGRDKGNARDTLSDMRAACSRRWLGSFVALAKNHLPPENALNTPGRQVVLLVTLDNQGRQVALELQSSSGNLAFDQGAIEVAEDCGKFSPPGTELRSDDGFTYIKWTFARDEAKGCSQVAPTQKDVPDKVAIPALFRDGRVARAWERVEEAARDKPGPQPCGCMRASTFVTGWEALPTWRRWQPCSKGAGFQAAGNTTVRWKRLRRRLGPHRGHRPGQPFRQSWPRACAGVGATFARPWDRCS